MKFKDGNLLPVMCPSHLTEVSGFVTHLTVSENLDFLLVRKVN